MGTTGTAFTLAFQSSVGQVGGVIGPQLFQSRYAYNGYKVPFTICATAIGVGWLANIGTWWLTKDVESSIKSERRSRIQAREEDGTSAGGNGEV